MDRDPWNYYLTAAARAGVPRMWLEDAAQDIALRVWRSKNVNPVLVVRRAAVDAARHYGDRKRNGKSRYVEVSSHRLVYFGTHDRSMRSFEKWLDFKLAWAQLTTVQQKHILRALGDGRHGTGQRTTPSQQSRTYQSRQRLRQLLE